MAAISPTPTIVEDRSESSSINEEYQHRFFPGPEEQKKDPFLVEFEPDDPLNPKVSVFVIDHVYQSRSFISMRRIGLMCIDGILRCSAVFSSSMRMYIFT